ncbi:MAG TPA: BrnA antitoxin family protein [Caulobacteraceae bacterium]|jgi:uncharacterized protein (DUF4415 family)
MKKRLVRVTAAEPLTTERRRELEVLVARPDSEIDVSDIPEWDAAMFARAERGRFYRPLKSQLTVRLDSDVLAWVKAKGRGYQTRINAILRQAMLEDASQK